MNDMKLIQTKDMTIAQETWKGVNVVLRHAAATGGVLIGCTGHW